MSRNALLLLVLAALVALTPAASRATGPYLTYTAVDLGDGFWGYTFRVVNDASRTGPCHATIAFTGLIENHGCSDPAGRLKADIASTGSEHFNFRAGVNDPGQRAALDTAGIAAVTVLDASDTATLGTRLNDFSAYPGDDVVLDYEMEDNSHELFAWSTHFNTPNSVSPANRATRQPIWESLLDTLHTARPNSQIGAYAFPNSETPCCYGDWVYPGDWEYTWAGSRSRTVAEAQMAAMNPVIDYCQGAVSPHTAYSPVLCPNYYSNWYETEPGEWTVAVGKQLPLLRNQYPQPNNRIEPFLQPVYYYMVEPGDPDDIIHYPIEGGLRAGNDDGWYDALGNPEGFSGEYLVRQLLALHELRADGAVLFSTVACRYTDGRAYNKPFDELDCWPTVKWVLGLSTTGAVSITDYPVNTERAADLYGTSTGAYTAAYDKSHDSWAYDGWMAVPGSVNSQTFTGYAEGAGSYAVSLYSIAPFTGSESSRELVYIVAKGNLHWTGSVVWDGDEANPCESSGETPTIPGDFSGDGVVDQADYTTWADCYGTDGAAFAMGSRGAATGLVSQADYTTWADHFGQGSSQIEIDKNNMMSMNNSFMQTNTLEGGPALSYTAADLGGGLTGYTFYISNDDGLDASYAVTLAFQGTGGATLHQTLDAAGGEVEREAVANLRDGHYGYAKAQDTWAYEPFGGIAAPGTSPLTADDFSGFRPTMFDAVPIDETTSNWWEFSCGTGSNSACGDGTSAAYVVADGDVSWTGTIARSGVMYHVSGTTAGQ